jgi:hypothetical protein
MRKCIHLLIITSLAACASTTHLTHIDKNVDITKEGNYVTISTESEKKHNVFGGLDHKVYITSLNSESLHTIGWNSAYPEVVHVLPGLHRMVVRYSHYGKYANGCLWLDAKPTENYIVRKEVHENTNTVQFWLENIKTNEKVGGACGSGPKY